MAEVDGALRREFERLFGLAEQSVGRRATAG
jgi:hypothetical protein